MRGAMAFDALCKKDPLREHIRNIYDAVPLRIPEARIEPLTLFVSESKNARYIGHFRDLVEKQLLPIKVDSNPIPDITSKKSASTEWATAFNLLGPFITSMLSISEIKINAKLKTSIEKSRNVQIGIAKSTRKSISPLRIAKLLDEMRPVIPPSFDWNEKSSRILLVDSVLTSKELLIEFLGDNEANAAMNFEQALLGEVSKDFVIRTGAMLALKTKREVSFAFTCVEAEAGPNGTITKIKVDNSLDDVMQAAPVALVSNVKHIQLGEPDDHFRFDE